MQEKTPEFNYSFRYVQQQGGFEVPEEQDPETWALQQIWGRRGFQDVAEQIGPATAAYLFDIVALVGGRRLCEIVNPGGGDVLDPPFIDDDDIEAAILEELDDPSPATTLRVQSFPTHNLVAAA